ncbi:hypothetical protein Hanom_Chr07g00640221 [Helianthus anomalus]
MQTTTKITQTLNQNTISRNSQILQSSSSSSFSHTQHSRSLPLSKQKENSFFLI